jgi:hypothetical protein
MKLKPQTKLGKWSVTLNSIFLAVVSISLLLVKGFRILSFEDRWWDITVLVFLLPIIAFFLGITAIKAHKERSKSVYISVIIGFLTILFLLLHSLFISD